MKKIKPSYVFLLLAIALFFFNPLASIAASYLQESSVVASSVYGGYRLINRLVAMVADTQISVQGGVVVASATASFAPGKLLQSFLDTLDRFADLLFPLIVITGILGIVISPLAKLGAALAAIGLIVRIALGAAIWNIETHWRIRLSRLATGLVSMGFLIALIVPSGYGIGYLIGESITASAWDRAVSSVSVFSAQIAEGEPDLTELAAPENPPAEELAPPQDTPVDSESVNGSEGQGVFSNVMSGLSAGAGAVAGATSNAVNTVGGAVRVVGEGLSNFGGQAWALAAQVPDLVSKVGNLVSALLEFLIAYLIKTMVIPLSITALGVWFWRMIGSNEPALDQEAALTLQSGKTIEEQA